MPYSSTVSFNSGMQRQATLKCPHVPRRSDTWRIDMQYAFPGPTATRCCPCFQKKAFNNSVHCQSIKLHLQTTMLEMFQYVEALWNAAPSVKCEMFLGILCMYTKQFHGGRKILTIAQCAIRRTVHLHCTCLRFGGSLADTVRSTNLLTYDLHK